MGNSSWLSMRLGDACSKIGSGATPRGGAASYLAQGPYALVRSQNVYSHGFERNGLAFIGEEQAKALQSVELHEGDVLLNITGESVGRSCQVPCSILPARVNQHVAIVRAKPEVLDPLFLRYALLSPLMQQTLAGLSAAGATRRALTKAMIESLVIRAPQSVNEQRRIANVLGALDDKIELNRRMSETLEQLARSLFDGWIKDVSAENNGVKVEPSWVTFAEVAHEHKVKWLPDQDEVVDHHSLPAFDSGIQPVREHSSSIKSAKTLVPNGAVLVSRLNPRIPRIWLTDTSDDFLAVASTEFLVATPKEPFGRSFLYLFASSSAFQQSIISMATGTSGSHQRVRPASLMSLKVPTAPASELTKLEGQLHPLLDRIVLARRESRTLTHLRDTLLPKLISGELRVPQAEQLVSEVV